MTTKANQTQKAQKAAKSLKKGIQRRKYKVRTNLRFFKPHTQKIISKPKYSRSKSALGLPSKLDKFTVLVHPLNTEKANKILTERNTLTFIVHATANKIQIKKAFAQIYGAKPMTVNTLVCPNGKKKAFLRLNPSDNACSIASKMGIV